MHPSSSKSPIAEWDIHAYCSEMRIAIRGAGRFAYKCAESSVLILCEVSAAWSESILRVADDLLTSGPA